MTDSTSERNERLKSAMRQKETPLNKDAGKGQVPCGPSQAKNPPKTPTGRVDPYRK
jgi:hypothetical protein